MIELKEKINNMLNTIHKLEEDNIMLSSELVDLQLAYNNQMCDMLILCRLLKTAIDDFNRVTKSCIGIQCDSCPHLSTDNGCIWRFADEALKLCDSIKQ